MIPDGSPGDAALASGRPASTVDRMNAVAGHDITSKGAYISWIVQATPPQQPPSSLVVTDTLHL